MSQALIEHAEDDIDRKQRGNDEQHLPVGLLLECLGIAGSFGANDIGHAKVGDRRSDGGLCFLECHVGGETVIDGDGWKRSLMIDDQWRQRPADVDHAVERHLYAVAAGYEERLRSVGDRWNLGSTSRMIRYWLRWV